MDVSGDFYLQSNEYQLLDFVDDPNFNQFIDLIRGETDQSLGILDHDLVNGFNTDNQLSSASVVDMFCPNGTESTMVSDLDFVLDSMPTTLDGNHNGMEDELNHEDDSSVAGMTVRTTGRKTKTDRSKTLISERRRRGRMKEKLYELRALVPNITKMDKASIIGDAVLYVQNLQGQAKKLKAEIAEFEASLAANPGLHQQTTERNSKRIPVLVSKQLMQMDVLQVEERSFYVRLVCNKGAGVAASLYKALESLTSFNVHNSNLATVSDRLVLAFTLNVKDSEQSLNLPNLKLWVTGALLNQGFEVLTLISA